MLWLCKLTKSFSISSTREEKLTLKFNVFLDYYFSFIIYIISALLVNPKAYIHTIAKLHIILYPIILNYYYHHDIWKLKCANVNYLARNRKWICFLYIERRKKVHKKNGSEHCSFAMNTLYIGVIKLFIIIFLSKLFSCFFI